MSGNAMLPEQAIVIDELEQLAAMQGDAKAWVTPERLDAAFAEIRALNTQPPPGDEMPSLP
jgi:hypothetical protein